MHVENLGPLERAWARTREMLFLRFEIETWLVAGFACFLARLVGSAGGIGVSGDHTWGDGWSLPALVWIGGPLLALSLLVGVALLWLSSRGHFVFLENMLAGRAAIVEPWRRYAPQAHSLFLWRLALFVGFFIVGLVCATPLMLSNERGPLIGLLKIGSLALLALLGVGFVALSLLLEHFVVPLMFRDGTSVGAALGKLAPLLSRHPVPFFVFFVLCLALWVGVGIAAVLVGCASCCILFAVLSIPYVNTVCLLPFFGMLRLYGVEFLAQFGPDYTAEV